MKDQQHQPRDLDGNPVTPGLPMAMLAEVTHRCPLACPYCSNPVDLVRASREIGADDWGRVFRQAADLGVLQVHISGGEPGARRDLAQIVGHARDAGLYVNLITSPKPQGFSSANALFQGNRLLQVLPPFHVRRELIMVIDIDTLLIL